MKKTHNLVKKSINIEKVKEIIQNSSLTTKFYIGSDSVRYKRRGVWVADYATVLIVHIDGNKGGSIHHQIITQPDFDQNKSRPSLRLMNEVYLTSDLFLKLEDVFVNRLDNVEIHLDINPDKEHGSSCVINEAIGYIRGTCDIEPKVKPDSFAASFGADRVASGKMLHNA